MMPPPDALGLMVCDRIEVEPRTKKVSLIGTFFGISVDRFPVVARPFSVFALLTNAQGQGTAWLRVWDLMDSALVYQHQMVLDFPDRLGVLSFHMRVSNCRFPHPGDYELTLAVDEDIIAQRTIRVHLPENQNEGTNS